MNTALRWKNFITWWNNFYHEKKYENLTTEQTINVIHAEIDKIRSG